MNIKTTLVLRDIGRCRHRVVVDRGPQLPPQVDPIRADDSCHREQGHARVSHAIEAGYDHSH